MFTVKQVVNNATSIYELSEVTIARRGSIQWDQAMELVDVVDADMPDLIEYMPASYADPEGKHEIAPEEILVCGLRAGVEWKDCTAILCISHKSPVAPEIPEMGGVGYQFIYKGDEVYVMNSHGSTIETVK